MYVITAFCSIKIPVCCSTHTCITVLCAFQPSTDPYVKVYLVYQGRRIAKWKSSIRRNTLAAVFNEPFQFDLEQRDIFDISLELLVMDYDRFSRNDIMGIVLLGGSVHYHSGRSHWAEMIASSRQSITQWHSIRAVSPQEVRNRKISYS